MKKRGSQKKSSKNLNFYLSAGFQGVKLSFAVLLFLIIIFLVYLLLSGFDLPQIVDVIFRIPQGKDYFVIFSGFIIFEVIPFILGIQLGRRSS